MIKRFTGWHMLGVMFVMFGVIIAVNVIMATSAIRGFGGVTVENPYVASQHYNKWIDAGRKQAAAGWKAAPLVAADGTLVVLLQRAGETITGADVTVKASHPFGHAEERRFDMRWNGAEGVYETDHKLPAGRWQLRIAIDAAGDRAYFDEEVRI
ncbi:FixH family protein [Stakelama tenebrarum]|uniref:Nitrogen fixation protein FixH n=1 Tax=Stakelama tenebrarum TaxID=2711215 RepID=A0A6G6Y9C8_9SPHN|nr:FixH family protein [Sphingosinithalassobacter tenebrarum]QIG81535.1 hypothetical protein G5C33_18250 [Sphingosinithalassobacter tenebrarum]